MKAHTFSFKVDNMLKVADIGKKITDALCSMSHVLSVDEFGLRRTEKGFEVRCTVMAERVIELDEITLIIDFAEPELILTCE